MSSIIKRLLKIIIGVITYMFAIFFFVSQANKVLDFCPLTVHEAYANMRALPIGAWISVFFKDFVNMIYPVGVLAAVSDVVGLFRILLGGFGSELEREFFHPRDIIRVRDGVKVGDTAISGTLLAIFGRLVVVWVGISLMFLLKPFLLIKDVIFLIIMVFYKIAQIGKR